MFVDFHPQSLTGDWMRRTITFGNVIIALSRDTWLKNINKCQVLFSNWNIFRAEMTLYFRSSAWCTLKYGELVYILLELTWTWLAARRLRWIFGYEHCVVLLFWDKLYCCVFQTFGATFCFYLVDFIRFELDTWPWKASTVPNASFENVTRAKIDNVATTTTTRLNKDLQSGKQWIGEFPF